MAIVDGDGGGSINAYKMGNIFKQNAHTSDDTTVTSVWKLQRQSEKRGSFKEIIACTKCMHIGWTFILYKTERESKKIA